MIFDVESRGFAGAGDPKPEEIPRGASVRPAQPARGRTPFSPSPSANLADKERIALARCNAI